MPILRSAGDYNAAPIPQYQKRGVPNEFEAAQGANGGMDVNIIGSLANIPVQEQNALTSSVDTIDVAKMSPDGVNLVMNGVVATTAVSAIPVLANGFKHVAIQVEGSAFTTGNFAFALQGCEIVAGNYGSIFKQKDDGTFSLALGIPAISANGSSIYILPNIGVNYLKLTATRTTDGTLTVRVLPFN